MKQKVEDANRAVKQEFESERVHHQKLVKDYARLQQRFENLQNDIQLQIPPTSLHSRSPSNVSIESESSGEKNDLVSEPNHVLFTEVHPETGYILRKY